MNHNNSYLEQSWKHAIKHFSWVVRSIDSSYEPMLQVIAFLQEKEYDKSLFATTSHEMLLVSSSHRHDSKKPSLRMGITDTGDIQIELFKTSSFIAEDITCPVDECWEIQEQQLQQLTT